MFEQLIGKQLRLPQGFFGQMAAAYMNRLNEAMTEQALSALAPQPDEDILDIGFGGGRSLELLLGRIRGGRLVGAEVSSAMLRRASRRFRSEVVDGRLVLCSGTAESIPVESTQFDAVITINTLYFWQSAEAGLAEICRVLKPHGRLVIAFRPRSVMEQLPFTKQGFSLYTVEDVRQALAKTDLRVENVIETRDAHLGYVCMLARRSSSTVEDTSSG